MGVPSYQLTIYGSADYYVSNFADSRMHGGAKISIFMRSVFFSVYSAAVKCQAKMFPFRVNCRLQLAGLGTRKEEDVKPTCFMSKATSVPQTNHPQ